MSHKKAYDFEGAEKIQEKPESGPYGRMQWKGTDVCMDVTCICGFLSHIDGDFVYAVKCPDCGRMYFCNSYIELIEIETCGDNESLLREAK